MTSFVTIVDAEFGLDGGAMMGIVPRALWERNHPPDARNRIPLVSRFAAFADPPAGRLWLLDCGIGRDWDAKSTDLYAIRPRGTDVRALVRDAGFDPDAVTDVVLTHMHFDHAGGVVRREDAGSLEPAFPKATLHLQAAQWAWAGAPSRKDAGSFRADHVECLASSDRLRLASGDGPLGPRVRVRVASGHSVGMQIPIVETDGGVHAFCADLIPTWSHVRAPWVMAYDNEPLRTIEDKTALLRDAAERNWTLVSEHDPGAPRARARLGAKPGTFDVETFSTGDDR